MSTSTLDAPRNGHVLQVDETFTAAARAVIRRATATDLGDVALAPGATSDEPVADEPGEAVALGERSQDTPGVADPSATADMGASATACTDQGASGSATASTNQSASNQSASTRTPEPVADERSATPSDALAPTAGASAETAVAEPASATAPAAPPVAPTGQPSIVRKGMAGAIAEIGEQRRANAQARHNRRQDSRDRRAGRRASTTGDGWLSRSVAHVQRSLGEIAFVMALIGSAFGQTLWWASTLNIPAGLALSFSVTFEAIMLGADRRAMDRRLRHRSATTLRALSWLFAGVAAWMQYSHFSAPGVVAEVFGMQIHGSLQLGLAFAAMTTGGFLIHTLSGNARVNDTLIDEGYVRPLGAGRWTYPVRAFQARRLLVDQPHLAVEQAWERTRKPRRAPRSARAAYRLGALRTLLFWMPFLNSQPAVPAAPEAPVAPASADESTQPMPRVERAAEHAARKPRRSTNRATPRKPAKPSKAADALAWVKQQMTEGHHPAPAEIKRQFGLSNPHVELKRWLERGQITEHELARIKAA